MNAAHLLLVASLAAAPALDKPLEPLPDAVLTEIDVEIKTSEWTILPRGAAAGCDNERGCIIFAREAYEQMLEQHLKASQAMCPRAKPL